VRLGRLLGLRRTVTVEGTRYREVSPRSLRRAIAAGGFKEYDVTFRGGESMRIRVTPQRQFMDLAGPGVLERFEPARPLLRPGMRIVILESGTGAAGAWAAGLAGSAGAVVALDRDAESIEYARRRYPVSNVAYEVGDIAALAGETGGAFHAALVMDALRADDDAAAIVRELWRVLAEGGALIFAAPLHASEDTSPACARSPEQLTVILEQALAAGPKPEQVSIYRRAGRAVAVARRQAGE
jgi:SAM-dependent methyltransferase